MHRIPLFPTASLFVASIVVGSASLPRPAQAQTYEVLQAFEQGPRDSRSEMCVKDGELYGVTLLGGDHDEGTLFKVASDGRIEVLHSFGGPGASMRMPWGGLIWVDASGAFFGTTAYGGTSDVGTVFRMRPGEAPEVVHSFSGADGRNPQSTLLAASDGYVYGTTPYSPGALFRFHPADPAGSFETFYLFGGAYPGTAEIAQGPDGLYVAPYTLGGGYFTGQVYKISTGSTPPGVTLFAQIGGTSLDDYVGEPVGVVASTRALYVTTRSGYSGQYGAVVRIALGTGVTQVVHRFADGSGGNNPASALLLESDEVDSSGIRITRLVGTTTRGGANGVGTAFRLEVQESTSGVVTSSFQKFDDLARPEEGRDPLATLVRMPDGSYRGTTWIGALGERGSVFRLATSLEPIAYFGRPRPGLPGSSPAGVTLDPDGSSLLGVTWQGGDGGQGTAYTLEPTGSSAPSVIAPFEGTSTRALEGFALQASRPVRVGDDYYSTLGQGGDHGDGAIVRVSPAGLVIEQVYSLRGAVEGYRPQELVLGPDGRLYGASQYHSGSSGGAIFAFDPATRAVEVLWLFSVVSDGWYPIGRLVFDEDGVLYGATHNGGLNHDGTVFSLRWDGAAWRHAVLRRLAAGTDGSRPYAGLTLASDGRLYGTTGGVAYDGPPPLIGTLFRINRDGSGFELLHAFTGGLDGCTPAAALAEAMDGSLHGTASGGYFCQQKPGWWGSLYRVDPQTGAFETLHTFNRENGATPLAALLPMADGSLIGTASAGGPRGGGVLFRIASATVDPGGPYSVVEGGSVQLSASCSGCPSPTSFAWDMDGNGVFETPGADAPFSAAGLGGPATRSVRVRADYGAGVEIFADAEVKITNVTPTVDAGPDVSLIVGETLAGSGSFSDPGPDTWSASVDYGDGSLTQSLVLVGMAFSLDHLYTTAGTFTVSVTVEDGEGTGTDTLSVQVDSVEDSIGGLIEEVQGLIGPPGPLNGGQGNSLISKLESALAQLARGNVTPARNQLEAFVNEVEAFIQAGKLTEAEGRPLVLAAQRIIAALG
jgi:uncharacterized repeat protein (TIGR03803 family)